MDGADIDIEVKAKVIYESEKNDIINQYIVFWKVFDEQRMLYGMAEQTVKETIRMCKDRNILNEYLIGREKEVVTIMMSLLDNENLCEKYWEGDRKKDGWKTDKKGKLKLEEIMDVRILKKGQKFLELCDSYMMFITQTVDARFQM